MKDFNLTKEQLMHLRRAHRRSRKKREAYRINVVVLLGTGWKVSEVVKALLIDEDTARSYVERYKAGGIRALLKDNYKPKTGNLNTAEEKELDIHLSENVYQTTKEIIAYVEKSFDVKYSMSGMTKILHRLGYSYKKPKPSPRNSDRKAQEDFIKKYRKIKENMSKDDSMFFMDGAHPQHNTYIAKGWIKKGEEKEIKTNTRYHRININGAVDIDNLETIVSYAKRLDEESTLDFLEKLRRKRPKGYIYLVLDNAGYYDSYRVKEYAKSMAIELLFLPPYSPNLNIIERLWKYFNKIVLYNKYFETFEAFTKACKKFFQNMKPHKVALRTLLTENFEIVG